jgi:hypothetical protein
MPIYLQYILAFLGLVFACGYAYGQWKNGANQEKIDTITILKSDVETLRGKVEELTTQVKLLRDENALEREKFTKAILTMQGQDPLMVEFIKNQNDFMTYTKLILVRVDKFLNKESF